MCIKTIIYKETLSNIDGLQQINDNEFCFCNRTINNDKNNEYLLEHYEDIRKLFKFQKRKQVANKLVSTTIKNMARCLDKKCEKKVKFFNNNGKSSTAGYYIISV